MTIVRAQDNTSAHAYSAGDKVELRLPAIVLNDFPQLDVNNTFTTSQTMTFANGSNGSWTFGSAATPSAAVVKGYDDGSTNGHLEFYTSNAGTATEYLRIANTGAFGLSGANYGTSGQVLTSAGSGAAPTWTTISAGGGPISFNSTTVSTNQTVSSGNNGFSVGPITINSGVTVTVASGQRWVTI